MVEVELFYFVYGVDSWTTRREASPTCAYLT